MRIDEPWRNEAAALVERLRRVKLMTLPSGEALGFAEAFIPRLAAYTREDKAAKGLRSLKERSAAPEAPVYFSALEVVQDNRCTLIVSSAGGGKTAFARNLALNLAGEAIGDAEFNCARLACLLPRNELGHTEADGWNGAAVLPAIVKSQPGAAFNDCLNAAGSGFREGLHGASAGGLEALLIVDAAERLGSGWRAFFTQALMALEQYSRLRILLLADAPAARAWTAPAGIARFELLPLLKAQRRDFELRVLAPRGLSLPQAALSHAASHATVFAIAQRLRSAAQTPEDIADAWQVQASADERIAASGNRRLGALLRARELAGAEAAGIAAEFAASPATMTPVIESLFARLSNQPRQLAEIAECLLLLPGEAGMLGAIAAGGVIDLIPQHRGALIAAALRIVEGGFLSLFERDQAARLLARLGDPRDLDAMVEIPGGTFTMGSSSHPNSAPVHEVTIGSFRMGAYPVTNGRYREFTEATGRSWASADGLRPGRSNAPAVDLTWHDANAFCAWLTVRWRRDGRIGAHDVVRLPTEPEWERAARGAQAGAGDAIVYPWAGAWAEGLCNDEMAGVNGACAAGLFPSGRSPYGCYDMAGQVWEWCSTLWGEDMAEPAFSYPWREDGRENLKAPDSVRRVLRGGCFSSGPQKACVHYRGSLEANGFWRGNGFRVAVAGGA